MSYLRFTRLFEQETGKTERWMVYATRDGAPLGTIRWFGRWRQYAFFPEPGTVFNPDCLRGIEEFTRGLTAAQRRSAQQRARETVLAASRPPR